MASSRHQDGSGGGGGSPAAGSAPTKSLKSPRQLPRVPGGAGAPPRGVFDFPPEFCSVSGPGAPSDGSGYDFEDLSKMAELKSPKERSTPRSPSTQPSNSSAEATPSLTHSPPVFEFCGPRRHVVIKTLSCPAKSPLSPSVVAGSPLKFCSGKGSLGESEAIGRNPSSRAGTPPPPSRSARKPGPQASRPNESQGCPREAADAGAETGSSSSARSERYMSRRSTSDLTEFNDAETEVTLLSSPRRRGSMKGGLAYLASRRGSRDSQASNLSNVSNEEIGPLNFSAHPRGRQRRTSNFLELPVPDHIRPRVHSLPEKAYNPRSGDDLYRLRAFNITDKGVINRGDSIISRRSRSNTSVNSSRNSYVSGDRSPFEGSCCSGQGVADDSIENVAEEITKYRVVLLGDSGVGKTALVSQFMTSEFMNTYDASLDDEFGEKTVSILLDGEESDMVFIDHPHIEMSLENSLSTYEPHACIVVYSLVSRSSFQVAEDMLNYLSQENYTKEHFVIVVGNKSDLARSRTIPTNEGKKLATSHDCKFIETSSGIKHNVDELLVGVLKQIRLRESRDRKYRRQCSKGKMLSKLHGSKTALSLNLAREILNKICLNDTFSNVRTPFGDCLPGAADSRRYTV